MPKIVLVLAVPAVAFAVAVGISLGTGNSNDDNKAAVPAVGLAVTNRQPLATVVPQAVAQPSPTAVPDRTDCASIKGTDYRSPAEADWFKKNCGGATATTTTNTARAATTTGSTTSSTASTTTTSAAAAAAAPAAAAPAAQTAHAAVSGAQVASGQRLVIPAAGVNANIDITKMAGFDMPDPNGYFNALAYDMTDLGGGLGNNGTPGAGNLVVAGHVDCARCHDGGSGTAVFWSTRDLQPGDTAQVYDAAGKLTNYVATRSQDVTGGADWNSILSSSAADLTVITCTGTFNSATHEYDKRHYVWFKKA